MAGVPCRLPGLRFFTAIVVFKSNIFYYIIKLKGGDNAVRNAEMKLKLIKRILKRKKVKEFKRYEIICHILHRCTEEELGYIQLQLKSDLGTWERLRDFKGIIPIFLSICALIYSTASPFLQRQLEIGSKITESIINNTHMNEEEAYRQLLNQNQLVMSGILLGILCVALLAIVIYLVLDLIYSREMRKSIYLLEIVNRYA